MKILFYCQHVLGVGHYFRTLEIVKALASHEVVVVAGGPPAPAALPEGVREYRPPSLEMDEGFTALSVSGDATADLDAVKALRRDMLLDLLDAERPDVFFVELYPFGRKAFEFELLPALEAARERRVAVVCGLRDILVEKENQDKFEARVLKRLNALFDALFVHADPGLIPLSDTFSRVRDIEVPIVYTGYVAQRPKRTGVDMRRVLAVPDGNRLVAASAGGGKVGGGLLRSVVAACGLLGEGISLRLFTGPFASEAEYAALEEAAAFLPDAAVARFSTEFPDILSQTDLSVSMAGYNTVMALLHAGTQALVRPFDQNREQRMRAEKLAEMGLLGLLDEADAAPAGLARRMRGILEAKPRSGGDGRPKIDLDGAARTAKALEAFFGTRTG